MVIFKHPDNHIDITKQFGEMLFKLGIPFELVSTPTFIIGRYKSVDDLNESACVSITRFKDFSEASASLEGFNRDKTLYLYKAHDIGTGILARYHIPEFTRQEWSAKIGAWIEKLAGNIDIPFGD